MVSEQAQIISSNLRNISKYPSPDALINPHRAVLPQRGKVLPTMGQHAMSLEIFWISQVRMLLVSSG